MRAGKLAAALGLDRLHPAVREWAASRPRAEKWGVAFSGGADSLALVLLLWAHWPERRRRLAALHFDHRLRGRESRGDAAFCRKVCAALGVTYAGGEWTDRPKEPGEAEARAARQAFFGRHARVVWLGHQQDDIAETMLMRLARGSGGGGLAAPRPVQAAGGRRVHLRPLLTLKKAEIVAALRAAGIPWREDSTNPRPDFFRNRIRHQVLPAWIRAAGRDALAGAARARELLEEDDAALEAWLEDVDPLQAGGALDLAALAGKPRALWRRALHRWLLAQPVKIDVARQAFEALLAAAQAGRPTRHSLGRECFAVLRRGGLYMERGGNFRRKFQRGVN